MVAYITRIVELDEVWVNEPPEWPDPWIDPITGNPIIPPDPGPPVYMPVLPSRITADHITKVDDELYIAYGVHKKRRATTALILYRDNPGVYWVVGEAGFVAPLGGKPVSAYVTNKNTDWRKYLCIGTEDGTRPMKRVRSTDEDIPAEMTFTSYSPAVYAVCGSFEQQQTILLEYQPINNGQTFRGLKEKQGNKKDKVR